MAVQYASTTYNYVVDDYASLPVTPPPGQLAYVVATGNTYYSQNGTWRLIPGVGASGTSFDNPPAAPSAYNDEFDSTVLNAKWTLSSASTTNPAVAGTVDPTASLTTPIYDLASWPSWCLFQSDNSSAGTVNLSQTGMTIATNATILVKTSVDNRNFSAGAEGSVFVGLYNTGDSNEGVAAYIANISGTGSVFRLRVENNGVVTSVVGVTMSENVQQGPFYCALWKKSNDYWAGFAQSDGIFTIVGPASKTGVTTFDGARIQFSTANETPSAVAGIDYFRYYPSVTYALKN